MTDFGEMAVLDTALRPASVKTLTDTRLWRLNQATLYQTFGEALKSNLAFP